MESEIHLDTPPTTSDESVTETKSVESPLKKSDEEKLPLKSNGTEESQLNDKKTNEIDVAVKNDSESKDQDAVGETNDDTDAQTDKSKEISRELKLLLALSREANLDTNISHKRKSIENMKYRKSPYKSNDEVLNALNTDKSFKFPVTAESELENDDPKKKESMGSVDEKSNVNFPKEVEPFKIGKDRFCWRCHREGVNVCCELCPRSYHQKCLRQTITDEDHWPCPECVAILKAENTQTRSLAMKGMTLEHLCGLLKFAVKRMIDCQGSEPFQCEVSDKEFPDYKKYIVQPMNLTTLKENIKENLYGSPQAFEADAKWILHNSIIFNSYQSKLTSIAKFILKICKQEMSEIENCPSCYLNANTKKNSWFVEVCPKPHILVWAKLKGFPFWPAKVMCSNSSGMVDVRFFGAHDRAWVPARECYLYSRKDPNSNRQKKNDIIECVKEVEIYISNLKEIYGEFNYAPFKVQYESENEEKQLLLCLPRYKPGMSPKKMIRERRSRSRARSSRSVQEHDVQDDKEVLKSGEGKSFLDSSGEGKSDLAEIKDGKPSPVKVDSRLELENNSKMDEDKVDPEEDDDTQISSNISTEQIFKSDDSSFSERRLTKRLSEEIFSKKRSSSDDLIDLPRKHSRRNSDQSIKSDSSHISSFSEKISRVDIPENMEISLSLNASEGRQVPVQLQIENSEFSISPQNKVKITDRIIKKLNSSEDINAQVENESLVKSSTDVLLEQYKNLVKEKNQQFQNDTFRKSSAVSEISNDVSSNSEHLIADFSQSSEPDENISSSENVPCDDDKKYTEASMESPKEKVAFDNTVEITEENKKLEEISKKSNTDLVATSDESSELKIDELPKNVDLSQNVKNKPSTSEQIINANETSLEKCSSVEHTKQKLSEIDQSICKKTSPEPKKYLSINKAALEALTNDKINVKKSSAVVKTPETEINDSELDKTIKNTSEKPSEDNSSNSNNQDTRSNSPVDENHKIEEPEQDSDEPEMLVNDTQIDETDIRNIIHSSLNESNVTKLKDDTKKSEYKTESASIIDKNNKNLVKPQQINAQAKLRPDIKLKDSVTFKISMEGTATESNAKNGKGTDERVKGQYTVKIKNVAKHGSKPLCVKQREQREMEMLRQEQMAASAVSSSKKRTASSADIDEDPKFKVVPIQSIMAKKLKDDVSTNKDVPENIITEDMVCVEIKSEPESSDNDTQVEFDYMEKKRKYLSALNISERSDESPLPKKKEIRTRSKTEDLARIKNMDNLSKVIDDVATNRNIIRDYSSKKILDKKNDNTQNELTCKKETRYSPLSNGSAGSPDPGGIFVKAFASMGDKVPTSKVTKFSASIAAPASVKARMQAQARANLSPSIAAETTSDIATLTTLTKTTPSLQVGVSSTTSYSHTPASSQVPVSVTTQNGTTGNVLILQQILPNNQQISYNGGGIVLGSLIPTQGNIPQIVNAGSLQSVTAIQSQISSVNVTKSQNYIPQNEGIVGGKKDISTTHKSTEPAQNTPVLNDILTSQVPALVPITVANKEVSRNSPDQTVAETDSVNTETERETGTDFEFLNNILPVRVSKVINDIVGKPLPRLRPRPPGPISQCFDTGNPSAAGPVSSKINSISHRLTDYFRGMLVELLEDMGKSTNPEATISALKLELETLKHRHSLEINELKKNMTTSIKDIERISAEYAASVKEETRINCEQETIRRIEEAKSKQWCANCSKEAQFYCCWNTSYCDYPCQQKHWSKHMNKCTQHQGQPQPFQGLKAGQSSILFRPAGMTRNMPTAKIIAKPTRVFLNNRGHQKPITYKRTPGFYPSLQTSTGHVKLVDSNNVEYVASSSVTGKYMGSPAVLTRVTKKPGYSTIASPSCSSQPVILNQALGGKITDVRSVSNVISDDESD